jgi:hypothetical protein
MQRLGLVYCHNAHLADELHVLGRANVFTKVNRVKAVRSAVERVIILLAREVLLLAILVHLPRKKTVRDADDLVALCAVAKGSSKGKHGLVLASSVVLESEALGDRLLYVGRVECTGSSGHQRCAKELAVGTGNIARAHDVAEDVDVMGLGDDRLGAESRNSKVSAGTAYHKAADKSRAGGSHWHV